MPNQNDFIGIDVAAALSSIETVKKQLTKAAPVVVSAVVEGVADYLLDVYRLYPPPKHVSRKAAYGRTFQTAKQRRWFFWALHAGHLILPYRRTQGMRNAWEKLGKGANVMLVNETQAAIYTMGDDTRANLNRLVGWKTLEEIWVARKKTIEQKALIAANRALKKALPH